MSTGLFARAALATIVLSCADPEITQPDVRTPPTDTVPDTVRTVVPGPPLLDARDMRSYRTVRIYELLDGNRTDSVTWMAENLGYDTLGGTRTWCPDGKRHLCDSLGPLYSYQIARLAPDSTIKNQCDVWLGAQGICPAGSHLPSKGEWDTLVRWTGGMLHAGRILKSRKDWMTRISGTPGVGTDSVGFEALPAGYHFTGDQGIGLEGHTHPDSAYFYLGGSAFFWTRTNTVPGTCAQAWSMAITSDYDEVQFLALPRTAGLSVRCVVDAPAP